MTGTLVWMDEDAQATRTSVSGTERLPRCLGLFLMWALVGGDVETSSKFMSSGLLSFEGEKILKIYWKNKGFT